MSGPLFDPSFPNIATLVLSTVAVAVILSVLLALTWLQDRSHRALLWWAPAFVLMAIGTALLAVRGAVPNWLSIETAHATLFLAGSLIWAGARSFGGRPVKLSWLIPVPIAWIALCQLPPFADDLKLRIAAFSLVMATITVGTARELWLGRAEPLVSRWPAIVLLTIHAFFMLVRIPATYLFVKPTAETLFRSSYFGVVALGAMLFITALAFLLLAMTKERSELRHRRAAQTDALTGLLNRRAFFAEGSGSLRRVAAGRPAVALVFDLDHFKEINDRHGHAHGDRVLRLFAEVVRAELRATDIVGRIGGEEFAAMLPDCGITEAADVAERIRTKFAQAAAERADVHLPATVSIGIAATREGDDLALLLADADRATYRAKAEGRNCVRRADDAQPRDPARTNRLAA